MCIYDSIADPLSKHNKTNKGHSNVVTLIEPPYGRNGI